MVICGPTFYFIINYSSDNGVAICDGLIIFEHKPRDKNMQSKKQKWILVSLSEKRIDYTNLR